LLGTAGVNKVAFSNEIIESNKTSLILQRLNEKVWRQTEHNTLMSRYNNVIVEVWKDGDTFEYDLYYVGGDSTSIDGGYANNLTEAKRAAAALLARKYVE